MEEYRMNDVELSVFLHSFRGGDGKLPSDFEQLKAEEHYLIHWDSERAFCLKEREIYLKDTMENLLARSVCYFSDMPVSFMCLSRPQDERVQTSGVSDRTGKTAVYYRKVAESMNDDWYDYTFRKYQYVKEEIEFFEYAVSRLSGRLPEIIQDMVVNGMQWKEAAAKYAVSEAMLTKYRRKALSELAALYEGRAKHTEEYLLS